MRSAINSDSQRQAQTDAQADIWSSNVHFNTRSAQYAQIQKNHRLFDNQSHWVDFVLHCERTKLKDFESMLCEVQMMKAQGKPAHHARMIDLREAIEEQEAANECRDLNDFCKSVTPDHFTEKFKHPELLFAGNKTSLKQSKITKLYVDALDRLAKQNQPPLSNSDPKHARTCFDEQAQAYKETICADFVNLIDSISARKPQRKTLLTSATRNSGFQYNRMTGEFRGTKPQGGGIYPVAAVPFKQLYSDLNSKQSTLATINQNVETPAKAKPSRPMSAVVTKPKCALMMETPETRGRKTERIHSAFKPQRDN